jgi:hypothetical protein
MSATPVATWLALLEESCQIASINHLDIIFDQLGKAGTLLPSIQSVEPALQWYSLFTGLPEEHHLDIAPLLVRVDLQQPLHRHWLYGLVEYLDTRSVLVICSHWPFHRLAEHLGDCMEARHGDDLGLFRYHDPVQFALLFKFMTPEQQQRLLRPALLWSWRDLDGAVKQLMGSAEAPGVFEALGPFQFSDSQMDLLECAGDAASAVKSLYDELPAEWGAQQRFQACHAAMSEANHAGLLRKAEREAFTLDRIRTALLPDPAHPGR